MRRDVGGFRARAALVIKILERGDPGIAEAQSRGVPICVQLTDPELLDKEFPPQVLGTPYALFSSAAQEILETVVVVDNVAQRAEQTWYEAALGMMDNIIYR